jgi:protein ImuB
VDARAWEAGVRPGQRRATALALEPALLLGRADAGRQRQALRAVAWAALQFTPCVTEQEPHTVLLEVAASLRLFGGLERLVGQLRETLAPLRHQTLLACAPTPRGAALLACWKAVPACEAPEDGESREGCSTVSTPAGPACGLGPFATSLSALEALLDQVPLALWCTDAQELESLQGMGLQRLGDLQALPRQGLARRFGPDLLRRLDQARGKVPDPRTWVRLPPAFEARLELFARADTAEQVLHGAQLLLIHLVHWAVASRAQVSRFTLEMRHERRHRDGDTPACSGLPMALAQPCADVAHLGTLLRERLARTPLPAPTLELRLRCDELVYAAAPEAELFPTRARAQEGLARLVERLQARLGTDQVQGLVPVADHRPERGVGHQPVRVLQGVGARSIASTRSTGSPGGPSGGQPALSPSVGGLAADPPHLTRPAWLLPEPRPLPERHGRPLLDGQPLRLLAGPERIEAGWWDGCAAARDYFVAATPAGGLVWICRTRLPQPQGEGGWLLQGWFA